MNCKSSSKKQRKGSLHITQKVDYALIFLTYLAKNKTVISLKKIAEEKRLSFLFLQKIAGILNKAGLIKSGRGKLGGYSLTKKPKDISLKEIIEALEGPIEVAPCLKSFNINCKKNPSCVIKRKLLKINKEIQDYFLSINLEYFLK